MYIDMKGADSGVAFTVGGRYLQSSTTLFVR